VSWPFRLPGVPASGYWQVIHAHCRVNVLKYFFCNHTIVGIQKVLKISSDDFKTVGLFKNVLKPTHLSIFSE